MSQERACTEGWVINMHCAADGAALVDPAQNHLPMGYKYRDRLWSAFQMCMSHGAGALKQVLLQAGVLVVSETGLQGLVTSIDQPEAEPG